SWGNKPIGNISKDGNRGDEPILRNARRNRRAWDGGLSPKKKPQQIRRQPRQASLISDYSRRVTRGVPRNETRCSAAVLMSAAQVSAPITASMRFFMVEASKGLMM